MKFYAAYAYCKYNIVDIITYKAIEMERDAIATCMLINFVLKYNKIMITVSQYYKISYCHSVSYIRVGLDGHLPVQLFLEIYSNKTVKY